MSADENQLIKSPLIFANLFYIRVDSRGFVDKKRKIK